MGHRSGSSCALKRTISKWSCTQEEIKPDRRRAVPAPVKIAGRDEREAALRTTVAGSRAAPPFPDRVEPRTQRRRNEVDDHGSGGSDVIAAQMPGAKLWRNKLTISPQWDVSASDRLTASRMSKSCRTTSEWLFIAWSANPRFRSLSIACAGQRGDRSASARTARAYMKFGTTSVTRRVGARSSKVRSLRRKHRRHARRERMASPGGRDVRLSANRWRTRHGNGNGKVLSPASLSYVARAPASPHVRLAHAPPKMRAGKALSA